MIKAVTARTMFSILSWVSFLALLGSASMYALSYWRVVWASQEHHGGGSVAGTEIGLAFERGRLTIWTGDRMSRGFNAGSTPVAEWENGWEVAADQRFSLAGFRAYS